jgi:hypothetical protein
MCVFVTRDNLKFKLMFRPRFRNPPGGGFDRGPDFFVGAG